MSESICQVNVQELPQKVVVSSYIHANDTIFVEKFKDDVIFRLFANCLAKLATLAVYGSSFVVPRSLVLTNLVEKSLSKGNWIVTLTNLGKKVLDSIPLSSIVDVLLSHSSGVPAISYIKKMTDCKTLLGYVYSDNKVVRDIAHVRYQVVCPTRGDNIE